MGVAGSSQSGAGKILSLQKMQTGQQSGTRF